MAKYVSKILADPAIVDAYRITEVTREIIQEDGNEIERFNLLFDEAGPDNVPHSATEEMRARIEPQPGDYMVVQADGYAYLNPKDVFERKYAPLQEGAIV